MDELLPKSTMDLYSRAHSSMNTLKSGGKRGGGEGGGKPKKKKANQAQKPHLPKCALCGQFGQVAGDANCKAVPKQ